jgi:hypothetical protein
MNKTAITVYSHRSTMVEGAGCGPMGRIIIMYNREGREEKTARMQCVIPMPKKGLPEK